MDSLTEQLSARDTELVEKQDDLNTAQQDLEAKHKEIQRVLAQVDSCQSEIESLSSQNSTLKDQVAKLKQEYQSRQDALQAEIATGQSQLAEKNQLIEEAERLMSEFNSEKHEVKAKFKHLMGLVSLKASGPGESDSEESRTAALSSYKGREGEVDLNHCFGELEAILLEFKAKQESRIVELISDKEQLTATVQTQRADI